MMPVGYFQSYAAKKRSELDASRTVSRRKHRLYAVSDEQADVMALHFDEDVEVLGGEGVADLTPEGAPRGGTHSRGTSYE